MRSLRSAATQQTPVASSHLERATLLLNLVLAALGLVALPVLALAALLLFTVGVGLAADDAGGWVVSNEWTDVGACDLYLHPSTGSMTIPCSVRKYIDTHDVTC